MKLKRLKKISTETLSTNPWWSYKRDKYTMPSGAEGEYHYVHTRGSVYIIPVLDNGKLLLVNQYRYLNDRFSLEFPGGGIKEGENPEEAARKELIEETGYTGDFEKVGFFNPFGGVTNELCYVFIARNLKPCNDVVKDESEEFELIELTVPETEEKMASNEIFSGMTLAAWVLVKDRIKNK